MVLLLAVACGSSDNADEIGALEDRIVELEEALTTEAAAQATTSSAPTTTVTTVAPTTTMRWPLGSVAVLPASVGWINLDMTPEQVSAVLGPPHLSEDADDGWAGDVHVWHLGDSAWVSVRDGGGSLEASCDPSGSARLPLYGGLVLCATTIADLLQTWGVPNSTVKTEYYAECLAGDEHAIGVRVDTLVPARGESDRTNRGPPVDPTRTEPDSVVTGISSFFWDQPVPC